MNLIKKDYFFSKSLIFDNNWTSEGQLAAPFCFRLMQILCNII